MSTISQRLMFGLNRLPCAAQKRFFGSSPSASLALKTPDTFLTLERKRIRGHTTSVLTSLHTIMAPSRSRPSWLQRTVLCLTVLTLAAPSQALYFYLEGTIPKCFYEELPKDTLVVGMRIDCPSLPCPQPSLSFLAMPTVQSYVYVLILSFQVTTKPNSTRPPQTLTLTPLTSISSSPSTKPSTLPPRPLPTPILNNLDTSNA